MMLASTLLQAQIYHFRTNLAPETTGATGSGVATIVYNAGTSSLQLEVSFSGLSGNTTVSHIHGATASPGTGNAGVMTRTPSFLAFPAGVTFGTYSATIDLTQTGSFNSAFITANGGTVSSARSALYNAINDRKAYLNIHTTTFGGGEIRGYFAPYTPVPEPTTTCAVVAGLVGSFACVRRLRRSNA